MRFLTSHRQILMTTALLVATSWSGVGTAQDDTAPGLDVIPQHIEKLTSADFQTRQTATAALLKSGDIAIPSLQQALKSASLEQRLRIQAILKTLEQNSFSGRLAKLQQQPSSEAAAGLPAWDYFSQVVGTDVKSLQLYIRLLKAEPTLFATAAQQPRELRTALEKRSAELLLSARPAAIASQKFSVDAFVATLMLASDNKVLLRGGTSTNLSTLLECPTFVAALKRDDGQRYLKMAGGYILRDRIAVIKPLQFAKNNPLPEGLILARRTLQSRIRGQDGLWAMILIQEQGNVGDIALLEALFDNDGLLFNDPSRSYRVSNGDMALAVAISMRNLDPRDYGFAKAEPRDGRFRFALDTVGFESDEDRQLARQKYAEQFLSGGDSR